MYSQLTNMVRVSVEPAFLDEESLPVENHFVWAYHVVIENIGGHTLRLHKRHWQITDALGRKQEIFGEGVVGKQPTIPPGKTFEYTSGTSLTTPSGIMVGEYFMENEKGEQFEVFVPAFSLDSPYQEVHLN